MYADNSDFLLLFYGKMFEHGMLEISHEVEHCLKYWNTTVLQKPDQQLVFNIKFHDWVLTPKVLAL